MRETADVVARGQVMLGTTMLSASAIGWGHSNFHDKLDKGGYMAPEEKRTSPKKNHKTPPYENIQPSQENYRSSPKMVITGGWPRKV